LQAAVSGRDHLAAFTLAGEETTVTDRQEANVTDRQEAQIALCRLLLQKIRQDMYPSGTQMSLLDQIIPRPLLREYINVLLEKVATENWPSGDMLRRIYQLTLQL
jgi:hypothetical protein